MQYTIWARKREPGAQWFDLPYAPRDYASVIQLIAQYRQQWGNFYQYETHPA